MSIVGGVACANVYWQVTDNPYLAGFIGVGIAMLVTVWLTNALTYWQRLRGNQPPADDLRRQQPHGRRLNRIIR